MRTQPKPDLPIYRLTFARITGTDEHGKDVLTRPREIGAVWARKNGKPGGIVHLDIIPAELTQRQGVLFLVPIVARLQPVEHALVNRPLGIAGREGFDVQLVAEVPKAGDLAVMALLRGRHTGVGDLFHVVFQSVEGSRAVQNRPLLLPGHRNMLAEPEHPIFYNILSDRRGLIQI